MHRLTAALTAYIEVQYTRIAPLSLFSSFFLQIKYSCCVVTTSLLGILWEDEFQKACDVALNDGLDLDLINRLSDPEYFKDRGVKWGIARRFVRDIK